MPDPDRPAGLPEITPDELLAEIRTIDPALYERAILRVSNRVLIGEISTLRGQLDDLAVRMTEAEEATDAN